MTDFQIKVKSGLLHFKQPAGTSRGTYTTRKVWYLYLSSRENPERVGIGECAPLPKLSCDDIPNYEQVLADACRVTEQHDGKPDAEALRNYPSILFALETAFRHYE
ncbi:MAG: o-succinylbenzoate synthase, partial [Bacteroidaceae bacterium]